MLSFAAQANQAEQDRKSLVINCSENYVLILNHSEVASFSLVSWPHQKLSPESYDPQSEIVKYRMASNNSSLEKLGVKSSYDIEYSYKYGRFTVAGKINDARSEEQLAVFNLKLDKTLINEGFSARQNDVDVWYDSSGKKATLRTTINGVEFSRKGTPYEGSSFRGTTQVANFGISCSL